MAFLKPTTSLRILSTAITLALVAAFFAPKNTGVSGFLTGLALGLNLGVLALSWNKQLQWREDGGRDGES